MRVFWVRNCCVWAIPCGETQKGVRLTYKTCSLTARIGRNINRFNYEKPRKYNPRFFFETKENLGIRKDLFSRFHIAR